MIDKVGPTSEELAICREATRKDASPNDKLAMKDLVSGISGVSRLSGLLIEVIPIHLDSWLPDDYWRELVLPLGATLLQKDDNGCNACHHVFLDRLSSSRNEVFDYVTANSFLEAVFEQDRDSINEPTGETFRSRTCLHLAVEATSRGQFHKTVDLLLKMGADASKVDDDGNTAWDIAFAMNNTTMMSKLYAAHELAARKDTDKAKRHWFRIYEVPFHKTPMLVKYDGLLANLGKNPGRLFMVIANKVSSQWCLGIRCKC